MRDLNEVMFTVIQQIFFFFARHKYIQKKMVEEMHSIFQLEDLKAWPLEIPRTIKYITFFQSIFAW